MPARIASIVAASLLGLFSLGLLAAGGGLLWADSKKDDEGYMSTGYDPFTTSTHALATEDLDIDATGAGWLIEDDRYGTVRLRVRSQDGKPVFVGIAPTDEAERYLRGVDHDLVSDVEYDPFRADQREQPGARRPGLPGEARFWAASAQGPGTQTLTWDVEDGNWSVVVMNADASRGVDAEVRAGTEVPLLEPAGWVALIAGLVSLAVAALLAFVGLREPRRALSRA
jgi:hypothetical protein